MYHVLLFKSRRHLCQGSMGVYVIKPYNVIVQFDMLTFAN